MALHSLYGNDSGFTTMFSNNLCCIIGYRMCVLILLLHVPFECFLRFRTVFWIIDHSLLSDLPFDHLQDTRLSNRVWMGMTLTKYKCFLICQVAHCAPYIYCIFWILTRTTRCKDYHAQFIDEETEIQRCWMTCS